MSFLEFFVYYLASFIIVQAVLIGFYSIKVIRQQKKDNELLENLQKSGNLKIMTLEEVRELLEEQEKKTWN